MEVVWESLSETAERMEDIFGATPTPREIPNESSA